MHVHNFAHGLMKNHLSCRQTLGKVNKEAVGLHMYAVLQFSLPCHKLLVHLQSIVWRTRMNNLQNFKHRIYDQHGKQAKWKH